VRIAVISSTVFPSPPSGYAGLEQITWEQARGLAAKGHDVTLIAPDGSSCPNVTVIHTGPAGRHDELGAYRGYGFQVDNADQLPEDQRVRRVEPYWPILLEQDAIIDSSWSKWSYGLKAEGRLKAPVLGVFHAPVNTMFNVWPPRYPGLPPVEKPCAVCISEDQRSHFEALHSPCQARVAYNGIDLDFYKPLDVPRTDRFLFLARFSTIKGPDLAIEACRDAGVGLDLIGDTSITNEPEFLARCTEMSRDANARIPQGEYVRKRINLIGPATRGETVFWYSQAHCMLHPNMRFREPLGLAPLEAMACGCPVVAWRYGACKETVKDGESGYLVSSKDDLYHTVRVVAGNPFFMGGSRERCREWASQFSVRRMVDRYHELCVEAVETGGW